MSASDDGTARIWDLASGTTIELSHPLRVVAAEFDPTGNKVATADEAGRVRLWDARTGEARGEFGTDVPSIESLRFDPAGRTLLTADSGGFVRLWSARDGVPFAQLTGHLGAVLGADFVAGGDSVVSTGSDGTIRLWRTRPMRAMPSSVPIVSVGRDGRLVAGADGAVVRLADLARGTSRELGSFSDVAVARFSADGTRVVAASLDGKVRLWDPRGERAREVPANSVPKWSVAADPGARRIAFGDENGNVTIVRPNGTRRRVLMGHRDDVLAVEFSRDGHRLLSASADGTARVWNADTGTLERVLRGHTSEILSAVFSDDSRTVATAGGDGTVRIWDLSDGSARILHGYVGAVNSIAFAPGGRELVSAGADGAVRIWPAAGHDPAVALQTHSGGVWSATFTPDGRSVISAGADGFLRSTPCEVCGAFADVLRQARARADHEVGALERERFRPSGG